MADDVKAADYKEPAGKITEEDIAIARARVGIALPGGKSQAHDPIPTAAGISHFAFSYGDDNPLWHREDYAQRTRWRGLVAPPTFFTVTGLGGLTPPLSDEHAALFKKSLFRGVGEYVSGSSWEWYRPIRVGEEIYTESAPSSVDVHENSSFAGVAVHLNNRTLFVDRIGAPLAKTETLLIKAERKASKENSKYADVKHWEYTDEDIAKIDAIYAAEQVRGADARYWEDVEVGDELTPLAKGPLTVTDIIAEHLGRGMGHYHHGPLRYWWAKRQTQRGFYSKNRYGVPDVVQRLHWEDDWAQAVGLPVAYDYGDMRMNWLVHLVTNWMGDDAWLWKFFCQMRAFNFIGDWHLMEGRVMKKYRDGEYCCVDLELKGTSQRGLVTCPGRATVILPSREFGPAVPPSPPHELAARGARLLSAAAVRAESKGD